MYNFNYHSPKSLFAIRQGAAGCRGGKLVAAWTLIPTLRSGGASPSPRTWSTLSEDRRAHGIKKDGTASSSAP